MGGHRLEDGKKARDILKEQGYDVTFVTFEGGHYMPEDAIRRAARWMKKQGTDQENQKTGGLKEK
ncbi:hypothetical protein ACFLU6_14295 [Acidobacteriota bacterium]